MGGGSGQVRSTAVGEGVSVGNGVVVGAAVGLGGGGGVDVLVPVGGTSVGGCVGTAVTVTAVAVTVAVGTETVAITADSGWPLQPTNIRQMKQKNHR